MRFILLGASLCAGLYGVHILDSARTIYDQIAGLQVFMIAAVFFSLPRFRREFTTSKRK